jgi:hypothetical protein
MNACGIKSTRDDMLLKKCYRCQEDKELSEFNKNKTRKDGHDPLCRTCWKEYRIKNYNKNKDKLLIYHQNWRNNNRDKYRRYNTKFREENREAINIQQTNRRKLNNDFYKERDKEYYKRYKYKIIIKNKIYREKNKDKLREYQKIHDKLRRPEINKRNKERRKIDINFRIKELLRARLKDAVRHNYKSDRTLNLLGCSLESLKNHLQQSAINNGYINFNINSYSGKEYHIDHIIPCAVFNLKCSYHQKLCFNWSNLQILSSSENILKRDKL